MFTIKQLKDFYDNCSKNTEMERTKNVLVEYRAELFEMTPDSEHLNDLDYDIKLLCEGIAAKKAELEVQRNVITKAIDCVADGLGKEAAKMHYLYGMPWEMVAYKMQCSTSCVKARSSRSLEKAGFKKV